MTRGARRASTWLLLLLSLAGGGVLVAVGWYAFAGGEIEAAAGTPVTVEAGRGHQFILYRPGTETATATCTIAPANGETREVKVLGDEDGYTGRAWWSGAATLTCDHRVKGDVTNLGFDPWMVGGLAALLLAVPVAFVWALASMFDT